MARYTGGMQAKGGYYWNPRSWEVEVVPSEGGRLKGAADAKYVKVPFPLLFVIVPLLGALFLMFLPFIGFALFAYAIARKVTGGVKQGATELAATIQPGQFAAGETYFTGKPGGRREVTTGGERQGDTRSPQRGVRAGGASGWRPGGRPIAALHLPSRAATRTV